MDIFFNCREFGVLPDGESVEAWTLRGSGGLEVEIITYGGIVTRLLAPDREGTLADVVLGFNRLEDYVRGHPYFGAITGRVAGRITGASFPLDGKIYSLAANDGPNHLHGGICGFDKKVWEATPIDRPDGAPSLRLTASSPDGEEGYPGSVEISVTYTVTSGNALAIETTAFSDRPTPLATTNHSYFNLAGEDSGAIAGHTLQIRSAEFVPVDERFALLGRLETVAGGANDFREPTDLCAAIPRLFRHHGSMHRLDALPGEGLADTLVPVARLAHSDSGRLLEVSTTEKYLQFYTGAFLDGSLIGKSGSAYVPHSGICLECQGYPDALNAPHMGDIVLRPGQPQRRTTIYAFSTLMAEDASMQRAAR